MDNQKILIYLTAVGNAPILKIKKYEINRKSKFSVVKSFIKKKLLIYKDEIFFYLKKNSNIYYPKDQDPINNLFTKYNIDKQLIVHYSRYMEYDNDTIFNPDLIKRNIENLQVLGDLKKYDKLIKNEDGNFQIEDSYLLQGVKRWYNGDNRKNTIKYITQSLELAFRITSNIIYGEKINIVLLQKYLLQFKLVCRGLSYLKNTYDNDKTTYLNLELLQEQCTIRITKIDGLLKIIK